MANHAPPVQPSFQPDIAPPGRLDVKTNSVENWKIWKQMWTNYSVVAKIIAQEENYKTALFLHSIGPDALTIYNGFQFVGDENRDVLATVIAKFDQHFIGVTTWP